MHTQHIIFIAQYIKHTQHAYIHHAICTCNMPLCVTPMHCSYILIHDRVLVSSPVQNFYFRFRCFRFRFRSRVSRLQLLITTTPKTARCSRTRVMDIPARPEVSCLSLTIHVIKEFTAITMHRTELVSRRQTLTRERREHEAHMEGHGFW